MTPAQWTEILPALSPVLILSGGTLLLLMQIAFIRHHGAALATSLLIVTITAAACLFLLKADDVLPAPATGLLRIDQFSVFFFLLFLFIALIVALLAYHYLDARCSQSSDQSSRAKGPAEFYIFLLLTTLGAFVLVCSHHFASFILALELIGLALYPLLGYTVPFSQSPSLSEKYSEQNSSCPNIPRREQQLALESALKYLVQSALATALTLFGVALFYAATGSLDFSAGANKLMPASRNQSLLLTGGLAIFLCGVGFKLSLVPLHIWTADVYEGAPTPVTALLATLAKVSLLALILRLYHSEFTEYLSLHHSPALTGMLTLFAAASMLVGNLLALRQNNVKRLLVYSSIAHMGYLLVAFLVAEVAISREAALYYLIAYSVTTLAAFSVVSLTCDAALPHTPGGCHPLPSALDPMQRTFYRGLLWRAPVTAFCFAVALLSLAGIPLTIGFVGKFYLITAGVEGELWWLLYILIIGSALGLFYYLGLLLTLVQTAPDQSVEAPTNASAADAGPSSQPSRSSAGKIAISRSGLAILLLLTGLLLFFGIYPQPLINGINAL